MYIGRVEPRKHSVAGSARLGIGDRGHWLLHTPLSRCHVCHPAFLTDMRGAFWYQKRWLLFKTRKGHKQELFGAECGNTNNMLVDKGNLVTPQTCVSLFRGFLSLLFREEYRRSIFIFFIYFLLHSKQPTSSDWDALWQLCPFFFYAQPQYHHNVLWLEHERN